MKFELLADIDTQPAGATAGFGNCDRLGAANLRGTGFAARDHREVRTLVADDHDVQQQAEIYVTGLAGFLHAKTAAAYSRKPKDWYDIAYVLLNNDHGLRPV